MPLNNAFDFSNHNTALFNVAIANMLPCGVLPMQGDSEDESPRQPPANWRGVEEQVAAGLILMATCGIGFIAFTVPQRLDLILEKITTMSQRITVLESRVDRVEGNVEDLKLKTRHIWR